MASLVMPQQSMPSSGRRSSRRISRSSSGGGYGSNNSNCRWQYLSFLFVGHWR